MSFGTNKNTVLIAAGAVLIAVVAFVIYELDDSEPLPSTSQPRSVEVEPDREQRPLPADLQRLDQVIEFARKQAKGWRDDARLTRLYATGVAVDGSFDREGSVQIVFVSPEATRATDVVNGWRLSVRQREFGAEEIWQHPAPELDPREARWCPLANMVGEGAPDRFTLDVHYANRGAQGPLLLAFSKEPKRWLVGADPYTCKVHDRSRERTVEEELERAQQRDASGPSFDARKASEKISAAIAASTCRKPGGPSGHGTVRVTFATNGRAEGVEFLAGPFEGTAAGTCLRKVLLEVRVKPWQRGDGQAAARFVW